jgi:hypothetical protein
MEGLVTHATEQTSVHNKTLHFFWLASVVFLWGGGRGGSVCLHPSLANRATVHRIAPDDIHVRRIYGLLVKKLVVHGELVQGRL